MVAARIQLSGIITRWDDGGVGTDQTIQPVVISASSPEALLSQIQAVVAELAANVWIDDGIHSTA